MTDRSANPTQLSTLPGLTHHITMNNDNGDAVIHSSAAAHWIPRLNNSMAFNVVYTNDFRPQISGTSDLEAHSARVKNGVGLVMSGGTVCRIVDFGPGMEPIMHRTQSLDFGVVLEGEVEMQLDGGESESRVLKRGDVAIQRGTSHAWRNVTPDNGWARMLFVLQASERIIAGDKELGEDLHHTGKDAASLQQR
ncbi:hypothetical protein ABW20_dc0107195 [Dactylellina cionopaga]|nr:hypothetical protein ABW20_dc0107195 [Dactylellina cionopaga]